MGEVTLLEHVYYPSTEDPPRIPFAKNTKCNPSYAFTIYLPKDGEKLNFSLIFCIVRNNKYSVIHTILTAIEATDTMRCYMHSYLDKHTPGIPETEEHIILSCVIWKYKLSPLPAIIRGQTLHALHTHFFHLNYYISQTSDV